MVVVIVEQFSFHIIIIRLLVLCNKSLLLLYNYKITNFYSSECSGCLRKILCLFSGREVFEKKRLQLCPVCVISRHRKGSSR